MPPPTHHLAHNIWELLEPLKSPSVAKSLIPEVMILASLLLSHELRNCPEAEYQRRGRVPAPVAGTWSLVSFRKPPLELRVWRVGQSCLYLVAASPRLTSSQGLVPWRPALARSLLVLAAFVQPPSSMQMTVPWEVPEEMLLSPLEVLLNVESLFLSSHHHPKAGGEKSVLLHSSERPVPLKCGFTLYLHTFFL